MKNNSDFWSIILGNGSLGSLLAYLVIALFAATASLLFESSNRDIASNNTPKRFSWNFLFAANWKRLLANIFSIPLLIRVAYDQIDMKWMVLLSIGIGILFDRAFMILKNIGILASDKYASKIAEKISQTDLQIIKQ